MGIDYSVMTIGEALGIVQSGLHTSKRAGPLEIEVTLPSGERQHRTYTYGSGEHVEDFIAWLDQLMRDNPRLSMAVACPSADYHASITYRQGDGRSVLSTRVWNLPLSEIDKQQMQGNVR